MINCASSYPILAAQILLQCKYLKDNSEPDLPSARNMPLIVRHFNLEGRKKTARLCPDETW